MRNELDISQNANLPPIRVDNDNDTKYEADSDEESDNDVQDLKAD